MATSTKIKSSEASDKKRRAMAFHVLWRVGIVKGHYCTQLRRMVELSKEPPCNN